FRPKHLLQHPHQLCMCLTLQLRSFHCSSSSLFLIQSPIRITWSNMGKPLPALRFFFPPLQIPAPNGIDLILSKLALRPHHLVVTFTFSHLTTSWPLMNS